MKKFLVRLHKNGTDMLFEFTIDLGALVQLGETLEEENVKGLATKAVHDVAAATHAHIIEQANVKLHSRLKPFLDGLKIEAEDENTWVIALDKSVRWIDDGQEPHSMIEDLLTEKPGSKGKVHTAKDGSRYRVIPFDHGPGKGVTSTTSAQQSLISTLKSEMKKKGIPFGKMETNSDGTTKTGLLHSFDIKHAPLKTVGYGAAGQGWGPVGKVKQGPTGIPFLQGVRVYQNKVQGKDGKEKIKKSIMTFRIVSSKMSGSGRWYHPGLPPENLFEDAVAWAQKEWEENAMPQLVEALLAGRTG